MTKPKALILAGGQGMRLYPITRDVPKPLVPVANKAVISHILKKLYNEGVGSAVLTLGYGRDEIIKYFEKNGTEGVSVSYHTEREPMGTAGSAAAARGLIDGDFFCLGGDVLFDFDLMPALAFHRKVGALATVIVSRTADPCRYGSLSFDERGRITSFSEKPEWKNVRSDIISTGMYVLSPRIFDFIAPGRACDFAHEVFPAVLGGALYAYEASGYFCDIGTPGAYLCANIDASNGAISGISGSSCSPDAIISPASHVSDSVIMDGASVGEGAYIENSIVCRGATVMKNAVVRCAIIPPAFCVGCGDEPKKDDSICEAVKFRAPMSYARNMTLAVSGEQAEELSPDGAGKTYTVSGRSGAPGGAARTIGEMIRRGAAVSSDGVVLKFDRGTATVSCVDRSTVGIVAVSDTSDGADEVFDFAKNGVKNLF